MGRPHNPDPVRVYQDRVRWWPSGDSRIGPARTYTGSGPHDRARFAADKRNELASDGTIAGYAELWLASQSCDGTRRAYESVMRTWINPTANDGAQPPAEAATGPDLLCATHLDTVLERAVARHSAAPATVARIATSYGSLSSYLVKRGLLEIHPLTDPAGKASLHRWTRRAEAAAPARSQVSRTPGTDEIELLAKAYEAHYPGRGSHAVAAMAGSGLTPAELAGTRANDVDTEARTVTVEGEADRRKPWPALLAATGPKARTTVYWPEAAEAFEHLVANAEDGWLLPPSTGQKYWVARLEHTLNGCAAELGFGWTCRALRDHYALRSVLPAPGGHGHDPADVRRWLGRSTPLRPHTSVSAAGEAA